MPRILSDNEIAQLLGEAKPLPPRWREKVTPKPTPKDAHNRAELAVSGSDGASFTIKTRQSQVNNTDFSVILAFIDADNTEYRLRRYNGPHRARHTNKLERDSGEEDARFGSCPHIHYATERYQQAGLELDAFARPTDTYRTFPEALERFVRDNGFVKPSGEDGGLFASLEDES